MAKLSGDDKKLHYSTTRAQVTEEIDRNSVQREFS